MKIVLGKNFPSEPPKGFFLTRIFHPNVAPNGEICVNTLKRDWKADYGVKHILLVSVTSELTLTSITTELLGEYRSSIDYWAMRRSSEPIL